MKQIDSNYYFQKKCTSFERFIFYFKQLDLILNSGAQKILFIGVGDGFVPRYLKKADKNLKIRNFLF